MYVNDMWLSVVCEFNNRHQKEMFLREIGLHAQKYANHSRLTYGHDWEDLCDH